MRKPDTSAARVGNPAPVAGSGPRTNAPESNVPRSSRLRNKAGSHFFWMTANLGMAGVGLEGPGIRFFVPFNIGVAVANGIGLSRAYNDLQDAINQEALARGASTAPNAQAPIVR